MMKVAGLWKKASKSGDEYWAGTLSPTVRIMVMRNNRKSKDSEPDYHVLLAPKETQPYSGKGGFPSAKHAVTPERDDEPEPDPSIPF